jgi:uncharacterized membrane protein
MEPTPTKHIFMSYSQPKRIIRTLIGLALLVVGLYFFIGRMTFVLFVLSAGIVIGLVQAVKQTFDRGPCVVVTDEGINDKRLGMGLIRWSDVEQVRMQGVGAAYFISLELSNKEQYLSRLSTYARISNQIWRLYNVSPIHIKVAYMDVAPDELFEMIMSEVELNRSRR